jgi:tRNA threonylcarbamoyladenosine biosynthesis protein TsaE
MSEGPIMSDERKASSNGPVAPSLRSAGSLRELGRGAVLDLTVSAAAEMRELGRRLATALTAGDLVILSGGLGAGKTTLTQGIGDGLGVRGPITSPTFVIARVHPPLGDPAACGSDTARGNAAAARGPALVHADAYRLGSVLELDDLDLDTDTASSVTVVEWGEGLAEGLSADRLEITITPVATAADEVPAAGRGGAAADAAGAGADGEEDVDDDADGAAADRPRTVRISAVGERWEGVELPLLGLADRL